MTGQMKHWKTDKEKEEYLEETEKIYGIKLDPEKMVYSITACKDYSSMR